MKHVTASFVQFVIDHLAVTSFVGGVAIGMLLERLHVLLSRRAE